MTDESHSFASTRARLEDIVTQVRKKDTSLEKSLDLLEEGVRLANACTELIDHQDWVNGPGSAPAEEIAPAPEPSEASSEGEPEVGVSVETVEGVVFVDGEVVAEVFEVSAFTGDVESDDSETGEDETGADAPPQGDVAEGASEDDE
jgi:exodeoxyribonuclease VII small subunit